jgi:3-oxoacyl-[acyl-carrier-protein] synthase II
MKVAITGIGLMTSHGHEPEAVFAALMRGASGVRRFECAGAAPIAAAAVNFDAARWFTRLQLAGVDRVSQLAVAAAESARLDAALNDGDYEPERIGVYVGCGMGGATAIDTSYVGQAANGRVPPLTVPACMTNAPAAHVAMRAKITGPVLTYSVACASSAIAIAEAARAIAHGDIDMALVGGCEALLVPGAIRGWQALQTLASFQDDDTPENLHGAASACRPFDRQRSGFALGEGAAFLVLEAADRARSRGARSYAEIVGSAIRCDAIHLTKPDVAGQVRALTAALRSSGLSPADIGYCNAHGTATRVGDPVECAALRTVWGAGIDQLRVSSTKSMHGHLLGGAGALEAAITALALHHQQLPPTAHCSDPDPDCALNLVRGQGIAAPGLQAAISNSFAFGGTNAVLVMSRSN